MKERKESKRAKKKGRWKSEYKKENSEKDIN